MTYDVDSQASMINLYFEGGWKIVPFKRINGNYLGPKQWTKRGATSQAELEALVSEVIETYKVRNRNEIIYGVNPGPGLYVVDIDLKNNPNALQLWKDKVTEVYGHDDFSLSNFIVKTKSGGYHIYYSDGTQNKLRSPTGIFQKDSGIDIRGSSGMVVMPTSFGSEEDWAEGEYQIIRGFPNKPCTVLPMNKIVNTYEISDEERILRAVLMQINEALRNEGVAESQRYALIPDDLEIPSGGRDNTLYKIAQLCRMAGLSHDNAALFMKNMAKHCDTSDGETLEHWQEIALDKVNRAFEKKDLILESSTLFFNELDHAGVVLIAGVSKTYYYFRHGSKCLQIPPRSKFSSENMGNVLVGQAAHTEDGMISLKKFLPQYPPKERAYGEALYPIDGHPFFMYEGRRYVNTYHNPFASFEPNPIYLEAAMRYVNDFRAYLLHITGGDEEDAEYLLQKLAWIVQKPYRRLPTGTIIYSMTRGSGKDIFMSLVRELVGSHLYAPMKVQDMENNHKAFHDKLVCCASEVQTEANARGTKMAAQFMGAIKDLITKKTVMVNEKFVQEYSAPIFTNFFLLSNFELSSLIEPGDRRWDIFHATEKKLDQKQFGDLADLGNDGIWMERRPEEREIRKHAFYAIRKYLQDVKVDQHFDREEARMNTVKVHLMEHQNPPALVWLQDNLPPFFTEEVLVMATYFSPYKLTPEYVLKQLKEFYAADFATIDRDQRHKLRLKGPKLILKDNAGSPNMPILDFNSKSDKPQLVYYFRSRHAPINSIGDAFFGAMIKQWYDKMIQMFYGSSVHLPGANNASIDTSDTLIK